MSSEDYRAPGTQLVCLLALLTAGCLIRLHFVGRTMRYDEAWTFLHYASRPLFEGISNYSAPNNHIFHTALVHAVYMMFGNHPWLLRLPALMAGLAIIPTTYLLGTALHGRATGLLAAGFATLSAPLIDYSVNARGYTMMTFLSTTAFAIAVGVMEAPSRWTIGSAVIQHDNVRAGSNGLRLGPMRGGVFQPLTLNARRNISSSFRLA